jgi:hypothetical protein
LVNYPLLMEARVVMEVEERVQDFS